MPWIAAASVGGAAIGALSAGDAADKQSAATGKAIAETNHEFNVSRSDLAPYREAGQAALTRLRALLGIGVPTGADAEQAVNDKYSRGYQQLLQRAQADQAPNFWDELQALQSERDQGLQQIKDTAAIGSAPGGGQPGDLLRKFTTSDLNADPVYQSGLQFGLDEGTKALERRAAAGGGYDSGATLKALTRFANDYGNTKANEAYGRFASDQDRVFGKLTGIAGLGSGATNVGVGANTAEAGSLASLITNQGNASAAASIAGGNALTGGINNALEFQLLSKLRPQQELTGGGQRTAVSPFGPSGGSALSGFDD